MFRRFLFLSKLDKYALAVEEPAERPCKHQRNGSIRYALPLLRQKKPPGTAQQAGGKSVKVHYVNDQISRQGIESDHAEGHAPFLESRHIYQQVQYGHQHRADTGAAENECWCPDTFDDRQSIIMFEGSHFFV